MKRFIWVGAIATGLLYPYGTYARADSTGFTELRVDGDAYMAGTKAMNEQRWANAIQAFDRVIATRTGDRVDGALYWKAYSLTQLSKRADASASCAQLQSQFPSSSWKNECKTLLLRHSVGKSIGSDRSGPSASDEDDDLKVLALNSLVNQDPTKALPILRGVLTGNQSEEMKQHAIFVLTQSKAPEAAKLLQDAITGKMGPAMQALAIPQVGVFEGRRMNDTLVEVFHSTADPSVKEAIVSALFISKDSPRMVELARAEKNVEMKREIVSQLALMHDKAATDYMMELLK